MYDGSLATRVKTSGDMIIVESRSLSQQLTELNRISKFYESLPKPYTEGMNFNKTK